MRGKLKVLCTGTSTPTPTPQTLHARTLNISHRYSPVLEYLLLAAVSGLPPVEN